MKYFVVVLIFSTLYSLSLGATINHQAKIRNNNHGLRNGEISLEKAKSVEKFEDSSFDTESLKKTINQGADSLKSAVDRIAPLAQSGIALGEEIVQRFEQSPGKKGQVFDEELIRKSDNFASDVKSAAKDALALVKVTAEEAVRPISAVVDRLLYFVIFLLTGVQLTV